MVDRWEGIIRTSFGGCSFPGRVMASLLVCPHTRTFQQPSKNAILFMGDCVRGSRNATIERLSRLETVSSILRSKLGDPLANVWVVEASRFNGAFACYDGFLSSMSSYGEPSSYDPHNFPSSQAITSMFQGCLAQVRTQLAQMNTDGKLQECNEKIGNEEECREDASYTTPKTLVFGFSKGGVVLNQLLSEMSYMAKHGKGVIDTSHTRESRLKLREASSGSRPSEQALCPTTSCDFLASIVELHFLDVGLNCHGAYLTDIGLLDGVVKAAEASSLGLHMAFHGTPRQWKDPRRPWIATEKDFCIRYLRKKAEEEGSAKLVVSEKFYLEHRKPSLQMHLEILECFEVINC